MSERRDWVLLVLDAAQGRPVEPVHLQKVLFLVEQKFDVPDRFYRFEPYRFGPFAAAIHRDTETLAADGLLQIENFGDKPRYRISEPGQQRAKRLAAENPQAASFVAPLVSWALSRTFNQLVEAIYDRYPHYETRSVYERKTAVGRKQRELVEALADDQEFLRQAEIGMQQLDAGKGVSLAELKRQLGDG